MKKRGGCDFGDTQGGAFFCLRPNAQCYRKTFVVRTISPIRKTFPPGETQFPKGESLQTPKRKVFLIRNLQFPQLGFSKGEIFHNWGDFPN